MHLVICYDISDDRVRLRASKILEDFGDRVQGSVFEAPDLPGDERTAMRLRLQELELQRGDSIRIYELCEACGKRVQVLGHGPAPLENPDVLVV